MYSVSKSYELTEKFRHKVNTPVFVQPKLIEFDGSLSVLFFIEQVPRLETKVGLMDMTYLNTVEIIS